MTKKPADKQPKKKKLYLEFDVEHWDGTKYRVVTGTSDRIKAESYFGRSDIGSETWLAYLAFTGAKRDGRTDETDFDKWCETLKVNYALDDDESGE